MTIACQGAALLAVHRNLRSHEGKTLSHSRPGRFGNKIGLSNQPFIKKGTSEWEMDSRKINNHWQ